MDLHVHCIAKIIKVCTFPQKIIEENSSPLPLQCLGNIPNSFLSMKQNILTEIYKKQKIIIIGTVVSYRAVYENV